MYTPRKLKFLGAFVTLRKAHINFVTFVRPHGTTRLRLEGFSYNFLYKDFSKIWPEKSRLIEIWGK